MREDAGVVKPLLAWHEWLVAWHRVTRVLEPGTIFGMKRYVTWRTARMCGTSALGRPRASGLVGAGKVACGLLQRGEFSLEGRTLASRCAWSGAA